ncbi:urea ABC transporter substrate-binding protein [Microbacterium pseudoresistens]
MTACSGLTESPQQDDGGDVIKVGSVLDMTGPLNVYSLVKSQVAELAIDDINQSGGVLGRQLELIQYDSQSSTAKNVEFANQLVNKDQVAVVMGGTTSAAREAMRPVLDRAETLYFFNAGYEGGVCDINEITTGETASQYIKPLFDYATASGPKSIYIVAADYNFGQISAQWLQKYADESGSTIVGTDFISLDSGDFSATLSKIQAAKPDVIASFVVGANHVPFYRELQTRGILDSTTVISNAFGLGNEQETLPAEDTNGIITAYNYYEELDNPANKDFLAKFEDAFGSDHSYISGLAEKDWEAWHLWAAAVEKAGSTDRDKVLEAIATGDVSFDGPAGTVTIDPKTNHTIRDISIAQVDNRAFTVLDTLTAQVPTFEQEVCDLVANPDDNQQYTP